MALVHTGLHTWRLLPPPPSAAAGPGRAVRQAALAARAPAEEVEAEASARAGLAAFSSTCRAPAGWTARVRDRSVKALRHTPHPHKLHVGGRLGRSRRGALTCRRQRQAAVRRGGRMRAARCSSRPGSTAEVITTSVVLQRQADRPGRRGSHSKGCRQGLPCLTNDGPQGTEVHRGQDL